MHTFNYHGRSYIMENPGSHIGEIIERTKKPYELALLEDVYQRGLEGTVAIDVGAHVGNHSLWFAAVCGMEVKAFEPFPQNMFKFRRNVAMNMGIDILPHAMALSNAEGYMHYGGSTEDIEWGKARLEDGPGPIPATPLDSYEFSNVSLIKIDVEGMEDRVLLGAARTIEENHPVIYAEAPAQEDVDRITRVLSPMGYTLVRHGGLSYTPVGVWEYDS